MTPADENLIRYRRQKALETIKDAEMLFANERLFSTVNRIYYALFYEITALLLTRNLSSAKHSGLRALFNEHFIKTGVVPVEIGKFYAQIFDFRQKSDYGDFTEFDKSKVAEWLSEAKRALDTLESIVERN